MKYDHVHKYLRVKLSPIYTVYRCVVPNCRHYVHERLVIGLNSICWICDTPFTMTYKSLLKKPHCKNCKPRLSKDREKRFEQTEKNL